MIMMLVVACVVGILVLTGCQRITDNPVANTNSNSINVPRINLVVGGTTQLVFSGWRPPISLGKPFNPGMQVPVKFIVLDQTGNPAKSGVDATIVIGDITSDPAVIDDSTTGQWVANITLPGVGTYDVVLIGNVMNVAPLTITIEEAVPQDDTEEDHGENGCGGGCGQHHDGGNCDGWGNYNGGNCGKQGNTNNGYGNNYNGGNCGNRGNTNNGYGNNSNGGNCGNRGNTNNGYGNNSNGGNCGNRGNTNNGYGNKSGNGCGNYGRF
jgi:hypothetical protein